MPPYREIRSEVLRKISRADLELAFKARGVTFSKQSGKTWQPVHLDPGDDNPSGSVNCEIGVLHDHRTGESVCFEKIFGDGDYRTGAKKLLELAKMSNGDCGAKNGVLPKSWPEPVEIPAQSLLDEDRLQTFFAACSDFLRSVDENYPIKKYLMVGRGFDLDLAMERGVGILRKDAVEALLAATKDERIASFLENCWEINERLVFPLRDKNNRLVGFDTRGLPRPGKSNPKNKYKPHVFDGFGYFGSVGPGTLHVFEGEPNILQADKANGALVNGIAVGPAGNGKSHADIIRKLATDMIVVGDDDPKGREMTQAIADEAPILAVFAEDGDDADEYLKAGHSWAELLARGVPMSRSWEADKALLRDLLLERQDPEVLAEICAIVSAAVRKHGKLIRANALYYLEK